MEDYRHTQYASRLILIPVFIAIILTGFWGIKDSQTFALILSGLFIIVLTLFFSLTVSVDKKYVKVAYGIGLIRFKLILNDITACQPVENRWWYGWGIRFTQYGRLFNISGLKAVELMMNNKENYRIGTDEPETLCQIIKQFHS